MSSSSSEATKTMSERRLVMLIGKTGQGKSTAGSFLVDPNHYRKNPCFPRAKNMRPETKETKVVDMMWSPSTKTMYGKMAEFVQPKKIPSGTVRPRPPSPTLKLKMEAFEPQQESQEQTTKEKSAAERAQNTVREDDAEVETHKVPQYRLSFADTPGLEEGDDADTKHMVNVLKILQEAGSVAAIILCVKMDSKIAKPLQDLILYYRRVLGPIVETNFLVLMTAVSMDKEAREKRDLDGMHVENLVEELKMELLDLFKAPFPPTVIPFDGLPNSESSKWAEAQRHMVLTKITELPPVRIPDLKFAKLDFMKVEDEREKARLEGKLSGFQQRLVQTQAGIEKTLAALMENEANTKKAKKTQEEELANIKQWSKEGEMQTGNFQCIIYGGKIGWDREKVDFCIDAKPPVPISRVSTVLLYGTFLEKLNRSELQVTGTAAGGWIAGVHRRFHLDISTYAEKPVYFAKDIQEARRLIGEAKESQKKLEEERTIILAKDSIYKDGLAALEQEIQIIGPQIAKLDNDYLDSLDEAMIRINNRQ